MKQAIFTGTLVGLIHTLFNLYAMLTPLAHQTWSIINTITYLLLSLTLITLVAILIRSNHQLNDTIAAVALASLIFSSLFLLMYTTTTWFFADQLHQLPFFAKDYAIRGYTSPQQYLFTPTPTHDHYHYHQLLRSQLFAYSLIVLFQVILGALSALIFKFIIPTYLPKFPLSTP